MSDVTLDIHSGMASLIAIYLNVDCLLLVAPMFTDRLGRAISIRSFLLVLMFAQTVLFACGHRDILFVVSVTLLWFVSSFLTAVVPRILPVTGPSHGRPESAKWYAMVAGVQVYVAFVFIETLARSEIPESMAWQRKVIRTAIFARWLKDLAELADGTRAKFGPVHDNDTKFTRTVVGVANLLPESAVVNRGLFYCDCVTVICCVVLFATPPLCALALVWLILSFEFENLAEYRRVVF